MGTKRFTPPHKFDKTDINKVPTGKPIVYELLNKNGVNIYTGSAKRPRGQERLEEHLPGGQDPVPGATSFRVKQMPTIAEAQQEEQRIIQKEKPKYNKP